MPVCVICLRIFPNLKKVLKHVRFSHPAVNEYSCKENGCNRSFKTEHSYRRHFKLKHEKRDENCKSSESEALPSRPFNPALSTNQTFFINTQDLTEEEISPDETFDPGANDNSDPHSNENSDNSVNETDPNIKEKFNNELVKFMCMLYGHASIPRNQIQKIIKFLSNLFDFGMGSILSQITSFLTKTGVKKEDIAFCEEIFQDFKTVFQSFSTEYKRFKKFEGSNLLLKPVPYRIGQSIGLRKKGPKRVPFPINMIGHYIPFSELLHLFFNKGDVLESILNYQNSLSQDTENISNFVQGQFWKERTANDPRKLIPFLIYSDDYEAGNPLSSHSGIHKICGTYASFPTLPPERRSKLENIFMVLLFHSADKKRFGNQAVFHVLIDEINRIHKEGIQVNTKTFKGKVFPVFVLFVGDLLEIHSVCGFSESFICTYPCHLCRMKREDLIYACVEDVTIMRNEQNYTEDVETNQLKETGIKEKCVFNQISGFHATKSLTLDPMHDLAKGVIVYDLVLILKHFITSKITHNNITITLEFLNDRINNHDFGPIDSSSRPLGITYDELFKRGTLRMTASETLTFTTHLGLIIGDAVPPDDPHWELYLYLRQILDIVYAPSICKENLEKLSSLVEYHNSIYLALSGTNLKNKFHNLVHYQSQIEKNGPLVHLQTIRNEGKHQPSKAAAVVNRSRKNTTYSLTLKNQLVLMDAINDDFENEVMSISPKSTWTETIEVECFEDLSLPENFPNEVLCTDWVKFKGTTYAEGIVVIKEIRGNTPVLLYIQTIFLNEMDDIFFVCKNVEVIEFNKHFHAYRVQLSESSSIVDCQKLEVHCLSCISVVRCGKDLSHFISLRHKW